MRKAIPLSVSNKESDQYRTKHRQHQHHALPHHCSEKSHPIQFQSVFLPPYSEIHDQTEWHDKYEVVWQDSDLTTQNTKVNEISNEGCEWQREQATDYYTESA